MLTFAHAHHALRFSTLILFLGFAFFSCASGTPERPRLTIVTYGKNFQRFEAALRTRYPEVTLEFQSYAGHNATSYALESLKAGKIPDIVMFREEPPAELQEVNLYDLSGELFFDNFNQPILSGLSKGGSLYLIPACYTFRGIIYNKSLFERHGWEAPRSVEALEELIPKIQDAGITVSEVCTEFPLSSFNYFFGAAAPALLSTFPGMQWADDFASGRSTDALRLTPALDAFFRLRDLGMFGIQNYLDSVTEAEYAKGNTAFLMSNGTFEYTNGSDEFALLPYLSEDGANNIAVTHTDAYFGISSALENNPEKLSDALKVMSFIATGEGQESLADTSYVISSMRDAVIDENSPFYDSYLLMLEGRSMALPYSGWEDLITPIGNAVYGMMEGSVTRAEFEQFFSDLRYSASPSASNGAPVVADANLSLEEVARLVGEAYINDTGTDAALISLGDFHDHEKENPNGVNAVLYEGEVLTADAVCTFNPLGWTDTIKVMTLTGKRIKEIAAEDYFAQGDAEPFPYVLVTKDDAALSADTLYTVACAGESASRAQEGAMYDTYRRGQDAIVSFLSGRESVSAEAAERAGSGTP